MDTSYYYADDEWAKIKKPPPPLFSPSVQRYVGRPVAHSFQPMNNYLGHGFGGVSQMHMPSESVAERVDEWSDGWHHPLVSHGWCSLPSPPRILWEAVV